MREINVSQLAVLAHGALFSGAKVLKGTVEYPIKAYQGRIRHVVVHDYDFVQQNKDKGSRFAAAARAGRQITWIFHKGRYYSPNGKTWGVIDGKLCMDMQRDIGIRM